MNNLFYVFDVESVGLFGEGFAVGYTVVNESGKELDAACFSCLRKIDSYDAPESDKDWVTKNVPPLEKTHQRPEKMREDFWKSWKYWRGQGATMVADCLFPVESLFLVDCIMENDTRKQTSPYPLVDLNGVLLAKGFSPIETFERIPGEFPYHNPLADARQSARILIQCLYPQSSDADFEQTLQEVQEIIQEWGE